MKRSCDGGGFVSRSGINLLRSLQKKEGCRRRCGAVLPHRPRIEASSQRGAMEKKRGALNRRDAERLDYSEFRGMQQPSRGAPSTARAAPEGAGRPGEGDERRRPQEAPADAEDPTIAGLKLTARSQDYVDRTVSENKRAVARLYEELPEVKRQIDFEMVEDVRRVLARIGGVQIPGEAFEHGADDAVTVVFGENEFEGMA